MKKIAAAEFKAQCPSVMEGVRTTREPVFVTRRGRRMVKLVPVDGSPDDFIGRLKGRVKIVGNIESPIESPESWKVLR